jgi:hypothetical protein
VQTGGCRNWCDEDPVGAGEGFQATGWRLATAASYTGGESTWCRLAALDVGRVEFDRRKMAGSQAPT